MAFECVQFISSNSAPDLYNKYLYKQDAPIRPIISNSENTFQDANLDCLVFSTSHNTQFLVWLGEGKIVDITRMSINLSR